MSRENVEVLCAFIDAFNSGDMGSALSDLRPNFEHDGSRASAQNIRGVYGRDQLREFFAEFARSWESRWIEPHEFIEVGEQVVVPWTFHAGGRDGIRVQARVTIRDGATERTCMYQERKEALEAAGLRSSRSARTARPTGEQAGAKPA